MTEAETPKRLREMLQVYHAKARALEVERSEIYPTVKKTAMEKIAPRIDAILPKDYSISASHTEVVGVDARGKQAVGQVPEEFAVHLRLMYKGQYFNSILEQTAPVQLGEIHNLTERTCNDLAREHGLSKILIMGEPSE